LHRSYTITIILLQNMKLGISNITPKLTVGLLFVQVMVSAFADLVFYELLSAFKIRKKMIKQSTLKLITMQTLYSFE